MYQAGLCWGHHYRLTLAFCGDSWVFLSCLHPYINADWGAEKQREVQECGVQRLSGKYEDKGRIRESNISVDRGETQYWYLTPGEKASKIQKQRVVSEESVSTDYSHSTNGLLARLYTCILGPAFRFVRCLNFLKRKCVFSALVQIQTPSHWPFSLSFVSTSHYSRPFTL